MRIIPSNSSTAALRRIPFTLVDATDLVTPEDITVTGVKVTLSVDGGTPAASTNDIVKVNGTNGEYYVELTQAEANQTAGAIVRGYLKPSGCALTKLEAQIGPADVFAATVDANVVSMAANAVTATAIADGALTAAKFAAGAFDAVWSVATRSLTTVGTLIADIWSHATRVLTAGTNIVLAKGTGVTGFTDLSAADVRGAVGLGAANLDTQLAAIGTLAGGAATPAQVKSQADAALADIHLDHLLAADYDPAAKPGVGTALLNELVENDGGVSRLTANALEQAPTGGSAPSAAAIRAEIDANSTQLAAIREDTEDLQAQVGVDGAGLTALGDTRLAALDAAVSTRATPGDVASLITAYDGATPADLAAAVAPLATAAAVAALPTAVQNADALLARNQQGGSNDAPSVADAIAGGLMDLRIVDGVLTVYHGDGATVALTRQLTRENLQAIATSLPTP
ncbi:MAG: hypothetical protein KF709_02565 [Gemmatimonadaceae bacterium]|nr:hypothetical protein [Gemmatimonadaceae bacterium]